MQPWMLSVAIVAGLLALLEVVTVVGEVNPIFLRPPSEVSVELALLLQDPLVQRELGLTAYRITLTFVACLTLSAVVSALLAKYQLLRKSYIPLLGALFGTPIVLLYLIFVVIFGRGTGAIVTISIIIGSIPIIINATSALTSVNPEYLELCDSFNGSKVDKITKVILPASATEIFAGIRIGLSYMITVVIAVEFLLVSDGIGAMISEAYLRFQTTRMFVGIVLIVLLVVVAIFVVRQLEHAIQR